MRRGEGLKDHRTSFPSCERIPSWQLTSSSRLPEWLITWSMADRAAQFSPFAALTGYDAAIHETGRLTDDKIELDEETLNILNMKLRLLVDSLDDEPEVTFTYFKPDQRKAGGAYIEVTGKVKKVDGFERLIVMENGIKIPMDDVLDVLFLTEEHVIE